MRKRYKHFTTKNQLNTKNKSNAKNQAQTSYKAYRNKISDIVVNIGMSRPSLGQSGGLLWTTLLKNHSMRKCVLSIETIKKNMTCLLL